MTLEAPLEGPMITAIMVTSTDGISLLRELVTNFVLGVRLIYFPGRARAHLCTNNPLQDGFY